MNTAERAGERGDGGGRREGEQLVAVGRIADEARALLVLADRNQHVADRRAVEAPEQADGEKSEAGDHPVVGPRAGEIDAEDRGPHHAAKAALAAGHRGPAERDREQHGGEREGEQREIDAAAAQDQKARQPREHRDDEHREQRRDDDVAGKPVALRQRGGVTRETKERAMAKRDETSVANQNVQPHAGHREEDDIGRGGQREAERKQHERQREQRDGGDQQRNDFGCIALTRTSGCVRRTIRADGTAAPAPSACTSRLRSPAAGSSW